MKRTIVGLLVIAAVTVAGLRTTPDAAAQVGPNLPPTVIGFSTNLEAIPLADAEAGDTTARLAWQTVGLTDQHHVALYTLDDQWQPLGQPDDLPLPASGSYDVVVQHPVSFGPPTFSVAILDTESHILDQMIAVIPYEIVPDAPPPTIEQVSSDAEELISTGLDDGSTRVGVSWDVANRTPTSNLVFEQVLEGGRAIPVELPRPTLWIPSSGQGVVAPVPPGVGQPVRLRLRVVDLADGSTLAEQMLSPISVTLVVNPPPVSGAPAQPAPGAPPVSIVSFDVTPDTIQRGGTVTLSWNVTGATGLGIWRLEPGGALAESVPSPALNGSWTVTLSDAYTTDATFMLFAEGALGDSRQASVTIRIICPFTYFFGDADNVAACPQDAANTVQAGFQQFEHGYMMWRADTSEILVLYSEGGYVSRFRDTWQGETLTYPEPVPPGLYEPIRGFGTVWVENPQVRSTLGWAVALEQGYNMTYQRSGDYKYARLFMTWPDGTVIYVVENSWGFK